MKVYTGDGLSTVVLGWIVRLNNNLFWRPERLHRAWWRLAGGIAGRRLPFGYSLNSQNGTNRLYTRRWLGR
jgi:hypothetical protein